MLRRRKRKDIPPHGFIIKEETGIITNTGWIILQPGSGGEIVPVPMPDRYIAEMLADRIAASKIYSGNSYTDDAPLKYYLKGSEHAPLHPYTRDLINAMPAEKGEKETFAYIRTFLKQKHTMK